LRQLTEQGRQRIDELALRYSVSADAVMTLLQVLVNSNGTMAQFSHWEFGGNGQWMPGGMTMVGDMFNHGLKAKVDGLCSELSQLLAQQPFVPVPRSFQSQSQGVSLPLPSLILRRHSQHHPTHARNPGADDIKIRFPLGFVPRAARPLHVLRIVFGISEPETV
jgi:hypothetical protein